MTGAPGGGGTDGDGLGEGLGDGVAVGEGVGAGLLVGDAVGLADGEGLGAGPGVQSLRTALAFLVSASQRTRNALPSGALIFQPRVVPPSAG